MKKGQLSQKDIIELQELYRLGFQEDAAEYVQYFFDEKINDAEIFFVRQDVCELLHKSNLDDTFLAKQIFSQSAVGEAKIISAAYVFIKKLKLPQAVLSGLGLDEGRQVIDLPFIVAAATLPELRGKGIFGKVMEQIEEFYSQQGLPFISLYPFKHSYYHSRFGFDVYNYLDNYTPRQVENVQDAYDFYTQECRKYDSHIVKSLQDFEEKQKELSVDGSPLSDFFFIKKDKGDWKGRKYPAMMIKAMGSDVQDIQAIFKGITTFGLEKY